MKVSLYVREHSTRELDKVKSYPSFYPADTIYVLRSGHTWETIHATNLSDARAKRIEKELELHRGIAPVKPAKPRPEPDVLMLDAAMDKYLAEIKDGRKKKTHQAYTVALRYFHACIGNKPITTIDRADMLRFTTYLREEKKQAPRSAYNKFENVMTFLKHFDEKPKVKAHDWPQYVEEEPEIFDQETLDRFFAECKDDERLLCEFFLMTGMREQEVIFATDRCVDFGNCMVSVRHNPQHGWTPKAYKERTIPVPCVLAEKLKRMLVGRGKGGLLFPTASGKPKFDFLDMAKAVARRAGIPEDEVWLHKFRATIATRALWAGVDLRTVQSWMGHTDLASTMRYLKPNRGKEVREKVSAIWGLETASR